MNIKSTDAYIKEIDNLISIARNIPQSDTKANLNAGFLLKEQAVPLLKNIEDISGLDSNYTLIADKLASQILQNSVNYFNFSEDIDAHLHAFYLLQIAYRIAIGSTVKEKCLANHEILTNGYGLSLPSLSENHLT